MKEERKMTVVIKLGDGTSEAFETNNYRITRGKDFHPAILSASVYSGGRKVLSRRRPFALFYRLFVYRSRKVQEEIAKLNSANGNAVQEAPEARGGGGDGNEA